MPSARALLNRGVHLPHPDSVWVDEQVDLERIQPGSTIHPGCRLRGARTAIGRGAEIGRECPVTLEDAVLGPDVQVAGGYLRHAVLLDGARLGSGAQIREGTLMEEQANGAHTVGLKQTILFPFVTTGSLINFCDVLMAGGTSRRDHSEVGSSYIHFNFTPWGQKGDKATASLIGDVPRGAFLDQPRIFLGGQGGLVGPRSVGFGTVLAAGFVYRRDYGEGQLVVGEAIAKQVREFDPYAVGSIRNKLDANLRYLGNLYALDHWYREVRLRWAQNDAEHTALYEEARKNIAAGIETRVRALEGFVSNLEPLKDRQSHREHALLVGLLAEIGRLGDSLTTAELGDTDLRDDFRHGLDLRLRSRGDSFIEWVRSFDEEDKSIGRRWLDSVVTAVKTTADELIGA